MTVGRTYDRRGCLKKEDKYASGLTLRRTPDRGGGARASDLRPTGGGGGRDARDRNNLGCIWETV